MEVTYKWAVEKMAVLPTKDNFANVVFNVNWVCTAKTTVDGREFFATNYGSCDLPFLGEEFTPYDDLTEEEVCSWIGGKPVIEANLLIDLNNKINPPIKIMPNPWA